MFGPLLFGFFALVHGCIALASFTLIDAILLPALCFFVVEAVTSFDNVATVIGRSIGLGQSAEKLSRLRFFLHATCIGLLLPTYVGIGIALTPSPAVEQFLVAGGWLLAIGIGIFGYVVQYRGLALIMPVNAFGCLRYAQSVTELTRWPDYEYSQAELNNRAVLPLASIITTLLGLIISGLIGWFGGFWVPFIVTALMLTAGAFPQRGWGPVATSGLEIVFSSGLLYSLWYAAAVPA
jgi:hypothetical protein